MKLTKSNFLSYLDAPLHLWLSINSEITPKPLSAYNQFLIDQGYAVEALAKEFLQKKVAREYPAGSTISFETTLRDGDFESRIDALVHDVVHNTYDLYEIKSSTSIKSDHVLDVTYQHLIAKAVLPVHKTYLVRLNNQYRRDGEINSDLLFVVEDMSEQIEKKSEQVYLDRVDAINTLKYSEMPSDMHCLNPKTCRYPEQCFPELPEFPIYDLCNGNKKTYRKFLDLGITQVADIPDTHKLNHRQKAQIQAIRTGKPIIYPEKIKEQLDTLEYPLYFLDYESYGPALPLFDGYAPYQPITNQFSIHVVQNPEDRELEHYEYLATTSQDPAKELAQKLCSIIGETGSIIVWNKTFEYSRNTELATFCPELADQLNSINSRIFDLMEIFSKGLYTHARFHGSASIKHVLPVLCPQLSYKTLAISDGTKAMLAWHRMVFGDVSEEEREQIGKDLLEYCELDTRAMVEVWRRVILLYSKI